LTNEQFDALDKKAKQTVLESVKFAESSPELPVEYVYKYAFFEGGAQ
jgi:TPP-dependent pyruvate/acetoin dehydrogenase alpha subunit